MADYVDDAVELMEELLVHVALTANKLREIQSKRTPATVVLIRPGLDESVDDSKDGTDEQ